MINEFKNSTSFDVNKTIEQILAQKDIKKEINTEKLIKKKQIKGPKLIWDPIGEF